MSGTSRSDAERWLQQPVCNVAPLAYRFSHSVSTCACADNGELRELHLVVDLLANENDLTTAVGFAFAMPASSMG